MEVNSPFYPRTVKTLTSGDERILETARLVNSPEFERLRENAKYETLKHWKTRIPSDPNSSDSMELSRIGHFLISRINVLPLESMHCELKKKEIKRFWLPMNFVDHLLLNHVERRWPNKKVVEVHIKMWQLTHQYNKSRLFGKLTLNMFTNYQSWRTEVFRA